MTRIPSIEELKNQERFVQIAAVDHSRIKSFVLRQIMEDKKIVPFYMAYQTLLFLAAIFFFARSVVLAIRGDSGYLLVTIGAVIFSLTLLVVIHELIHGLVLKLAGAPRVSFGMVPGKFIFYAEADRFVMNRRLFLWVALAPLVAVQIAAIMLIVVWLGDTCVYFPLMIMCIHSFFCAGDIALITLFYRFPGREVYTFDEGAEKTSYYFTERD